MSEIQTLPGHVLCAFLPTAAEATAVLLPDPGQAYWCGPLRLPSGQMVLIDEIQTLIPNEADQALAQSAGFPSVEVMIAELQVIWPEADPASSVFVILRYAPMAES